MPVTQIRSQPEDVDNRLARFGLTREHFHPILHAVAAARADTIAVDAATASGTKAWLAGVRHTNLMMLPLGWKPDRVDGVEEVRHPDEAVAFVYQNVDQACSLIRSPRAISSKGPAADRMIEAQKSLFGEAAPEAFPKSALKNDTVWFVCVSVDDDTGQVCAELSLPTALEGNNFKTFAERIFIVQPGEWEAPDIASAPGDDGSGTQDYAFELKKK